MEYAIEAINLTKYYGALQAVDHINFEVKTGEIFGFLGPNGAGKTTTIRMLTSLTKPKEGTAKILGHDIQKETLDAKRHIGIVPDISNIYDDLTAWNNLIFAGELYGVPKNERAERAKELLEIFRLYDRRNDHAHTFSRGMKRRLTIAAALIHQPDILFLDEPTTGLDVQSLRMIRNLIKELNKKGMTIFLTTHYIEEADQLCQRVAIINKGKIITLDTPEKLKTTIEEQHFIEIAFQPSERLEDKLRSLNYVNNVSRVGDKFKLSVDDTSEIVPILVDFARGNNLKILSLNTLKVSLEDAFVKITGLSSDLMTTDKEKEKKKAHLVIE